MKNALRTVSPAWLCHLSDSVLCTSLPALRAMQALCGLTPSAPLLQTPQLMSLQSLSSQPSQLQGMCNRTHQHCCCCLQAPCRGRPEHSDASSCTSQQVDGGTHDLLTAASSSPAASLQQQLTHRQVKPWQSCHPHQRQIIQLDLRHASQAQQRGFMTSSPVWQEAQSGRKQQPNTQQPDKSKQQPGTQQTSKQPPGQQQPSGSKLEARGQPGSQAPLHARPSHAYRPRVSQSQSPAVPDAGVAQPQSPPPAEKRVLRSFQQLQDQQQQQEQQQRQEHQQKLLQQQQQQRSPTGFNRMSGPREGAPFAPNRGLNGNTRGAYRPPATSSDNLAVARMGAPIYKNPKYNPSNPADTPDKSRNRANEDITAPEVRLVNADGTHEVLPLAEALQAARDAELDLVEVSASAKPPVCRLLNHSKVTREAKVRERKQEKKLQEHKRTTIMKEMHFGVNTAEHDLQVKLKKAREFVDKGHKVKCSVKFKYTKDAQDAQNALPALQERMAEFAEVVLPAPTERQIRGSFSFYLSPSHAAKQQQENSA